MMNFVRRGNAYNFYSLAQCCSVLFSFYISDGCMGIGHTSSPSSIPMNRSKCMWMWIVDTCIAHNKLRSCCRRVIYGHNYIRSTNTIWLMAIKYVLPLTVREKMANGEWGARVCVRARVLTRVRACSAWIMINLVGFGVRIDAILLLSIGFLFPFVRPFLCMRALC